MISHDILQHKNSRSYYSAITACDLVSCQSDCWHPTSHFHVGSHA